MSTQTPTPTEKLEVPLRGLKFLKTTTDSYETPGSLQSAWGLLTS